VIVKQDGRATRYTAAEFVRLPLSVRTKAILEQGLEFLRSGSVVPQREALKSLIRHFRK
jgi:hypothetical protein